MGVLPEWASHILPTQSPPNPLRSNYMAIAAGDLHAGNVECVLALLGGLLQGLALKPRLLDELVAELARAPAFATATPCR